jgi:glucokinase
MTPIRTLAADLGGTKTLLALIDVTDERAHVVTEARYASAEYPSFEAIVAHFVAAHRCEGIAACIGVAGPVINNACRVTNLPWEVSAPSLEAVTHARVRLVNDFEAAAHGVDVVAPEHRVTLHEGTLVAHAPRAVLGAGTGLGEAIAYATPGGYQVLPTEGGHCDFAPRNDDEDALARWLRHRHGHVSYERIVSGPGLAATYEHLRERNVCTESAHVRAEMAHDDMGAVIGRHAVMGDDALCARAFDLFAGVYGAEAGNLALKCLARGGVYLAGGIAAKTLPRLAQSPFLAAMHDKGRMRDLVRSMHVSVITDPALGLLGAAALAARLSQ